MEKYYKLISALLKVAEKELDNDHFDLTQVFPVHEDRQELIKLMFPENSRLNSNSCKFVPDWELAGFFSKKFAQLSEQNVFALDEDRYNQMVEIINSAPDADPELKEFLKAKSPGLNKHVINYV
jgi:hypothetical protein